MPNKFYLKGKAFEHRVKKYLEKKGYTVFRLAGSKPADLIAINSQTIYIIECKYAKKSITRKLKTILIKATENNMAEPLIATRNPETGKLIFINPRTNSTIQI